jgi:hypothetical protein
MQMTPTTSTDERNKMGFPVIPFVLLWPIIKLIAVPLIQSVLPALLRQIADTLDSGEPGTISTDDLGELIDGQKSQLHAVYKGE